MLQEAFPGVDPDVIGDLPLAENEVHAWVTSIQVNEDRIPQYERLLSDDETRKALSFRFDKDRSMYIVSHGVLRLILACYTRVHPTKLVMSYSLGGKPCVHTLQEQSRVRFSMSHTSSFTAVAVSRNSQVGVDIERIRHVNNQDAILRRYLSAHSMSEFTKLTVHDRQRAFFTWWTANEAFLKAQGKGIRSLDEGLDFVPQGGLLHCGGGPVKSTAGHFWTLWSRDVESDHILTIVTDGKNPSFRRLRYLIETERWNHFYYGRQ
jgi:4'-phosphopantetheinyl transferase